MPKIASIVTHLPMSRTRRGFSLIELIIVILIASLFAAMVFTTISIRKPHEENVGIHQLKAMPMMAEAIDADLVCTEKCQTCFAMVNGKKVPVGSQMPPLKAYILDDGGSPVEVDFGRLEDRPVCLRFHFYPNGSTSQMILEAHDRFYFIPSYFGKIETFESLDAAAEHWQKYRSALDTMGTYY
jgi:prepilin-type N-terminal cleavage/methylation domain-containing protein